MLEGREKDEFPLAWDAECLVVGVGVPRVGVGHDRWGGGKKGSEGTGVFLSLSTRLKHIEKS